MKDDQHNDSLPEQHSRLELLALLPEEMSLEDLLALLPDGAAQEELRGLMPDGLNSGGLLDLLAACKQRRMQLEAKIIRDVQEYGFFVMGVVDPTGEQPPFAYTIGLHTNPALCDLIMIGLDGDRLRRFVSAIARSALAGSRYEAGQAYDDFTANGLPFFFALVGAEHYDDYLGWAINYYARQPFPVLQVVWPDGAGRFPFQSGFDERGSARQPLLFDPSQYASGPPASREEGNT